MSFPRYPEYKDSGVEWLGEVPGHWDVKRLRRTISVPLSNGIFKKKDEFGSGALLVNVFDIYRPNFKIDFDSLERVQCDDSELSSYEVLPGDLFFVRSSLKQEGIAVVAMADSCSEAVVFECHLIRARPDDKIFSGRFGSYVLNSTVYRSIMIAKAKITTMTTIDQEAILSTCLPIPPLLEQTKIAAFLDRETAKIDGLVAEQRRLMALLKEKRQAVISHAVTQGLNPHAPMKHSGIEWLGDVPAHWAVMSLKRDLDFLTSGSRGWAENYSDDGELFIRITNLTRGTIALDLSDIQRVAVPDGAEGSRTKVQPGDILFSITAYLGSVAVVPDALESAYVSQHVALARLRHSRLASKWVGFVALSVVGQTWFETKSYGGTKIQLSLDDVRELPIPVPPVDEQHAIVGHLETQLAKFDTLTAEAQRAIDLLAERRTALISAAVTGQIDVRGLVPAEVGSVAV